MDVDEAAPARANHALPSFPIVASKQAEGLRVQPQQPHNKGMDEPTIGGATALEAVLATLMGQAGADGTIHVSCSRQGSKEVSPATTPLTAAPTWASLPRSDSAEDAAAAAIMCAGTASQGVIIVQGGVVVEAGSVQAGPVLTAAVPAASAPTAGDVSASMGVAAGPVAVARQAALRGAVSRRRGANRTTAAAAVMAEGTTEAGLGATGGASVRAGGLNVIPASPMQGPTVMPFTLPDDSPATAEHPCHSATPAVPARAPALSTPAQAAATDGGQDAAAFTHFANGMWEGSTSPSDVPGAAPSNMPVHSGLFDDDVDGALELGGASKGVGLAALFRPSFWRSRGVGQASGSQPLLRSGCTAADCKGCQSKVDLLLPVAAAAAAAAAETAAHVSAGAVLLIPTTLPVSTHAGSGSGGGANVVALATGAHATALAYHAAQSAAHAYGAQPRRPPDLSAQGVRASAEGGQGVGGPATTTTRIHADGICCPAEVGLIHTLLQNLPGVEMVDVHVVTKAVVVRHDACTTPPTALLAALNSAHMRATLTGSAGPRAQPANAGGVGPPACVLASCALLAVALISYLPGIMPWATHLRWAALGAVAVGAPPIVRKAAIALTNVTLDINVLMVLAVAGAVALGELVEAGAIVALFGGAEWIEDRCLARARATIGAVLSLQPETALVLSDGVEEHEAHAGAAHNTAGALSVRGAATTSSGSVDSWNEAEFKGSLPAEPMPYSASGALPRQVAVERVGVGALVLVRPGDCIPLDGTVVDGSSAVDEALLTGEARPVGKRPGDSVVGGSTNVGTAALTVRVSAAAADSTVARLGGLMEAGAAAKSRRDRAVEVFARYYTPAVSAAALITAILPPLITGGGWASWAYLSLVLLVSACPCALVISTPVTSVCGLARAAQQGVVAKGSRQLEALGRVSVVTLDKSGTLTEGRFAVAHAEVFPANTNPHLNQATNPDSGAGTAAESVQELEQAPTRMPLHRMLSLVAALEAGSAHPVAGALVSHAAAQAGYEMLHAEQAEVVPGEGIRGRVGGHEVSVGSGRLARAALRKAALSSSSTPYTAAGSAAVAQHQQGQEGEPLTSHTAPLASHSGPFVSHAPAQWQGGDQDASPDQERRGLHDDQQQPTAVHHTACAFPAPAQSGAALTADAARVAAALDSWGAAGATVVFVMVDGGLVGYLAVADKVRPGARQAVEALAARGVTCAMLTGDEARAAAVVGAAVGLEPAHVHAELLPQDKLALVLAYRRQAPALMPSAAVGFGVSAHHTSGSEGGGRAGWWGSAWFQRQTYRRLAAHSCAGGRPGSAAGSGGGGLASEALLPAGTLLSSSEGGGSSNSQGGAGAHMAAAALAERVPWWQRWLGGGHSSSQLSQLELAGLAAHQAIRVRPSSGGGSSSGGAQRSSASFGGWLGSLAGSRRHTRASISLGGGLHEQSQGHTHHSGLVEGSEQVPLEGGAAAAAWHVLSQTRPGLASSGSDGGSSSAGGSAAAGVAGFGGAADGGAFAWRALRKRGGRATHGSYGGGGSNGGAGTWWQRWGGHGHGRSVVVAHVGDGVNDAPALAAADVGIALGCGGAALAVEAADVALFGTDLCALAFARDLGAHVSRVITANIVFALAVKLVVISLAFAGRVSLWAGVAADVGSALAVVLHGLSVLAFRRGEQQGGADQGAAAASKDGSGEAGGVSEHDDGLLVGRMLQPPAPTRKQEAQLALQPLLPPNNIGSSGSSSSSITDGHLGTTSGPSFPAAPPFQPVTLLPTSPQETPPASHFEFVSPRSSPVCEIRHGGLLSPTHAVSPPTLALAPAPTDSLDSTGVALPVTAGARGEGELSEARRAALAAAAAARRRHPRAAARGGTGAACASGCPCAGRLAGADGRGVGFWGASHHAGPGLPAGGSGDEVWWDEEGALVK